jgi:hypothetical protein
VLDFHAPATARDRTAESIQNFRLPNTFCGTIACDQPLAAR